MRNLRNIKYRSLRFDANQSNLTATAWDLDDLVCAFGPSEDSPIITLKRIPGDATHSDQAETIASWDTPSPIPELPFDRIVNLHCSDGSISLVLEGGDIVVVRPDAGPDRELIEIVGSVDAGISAAAWSPDQGLLAIATKADTLLLMTREFEGTANVTLSAEDLGVSNHVSVGWGKKETQFKGRGVAKALRDPTVPEHVDEGTLSSHDDGRVSISWRGDGEYVAVNSVLEGKRRVIRVYNREGTLDSVSEPVNGLEGALSWKPSGQTLAGLRRRNSGIDVVFFERNGLRHGEFDLRVSDTEDHPVGSHISLNWNIDSTVLAVTFGDKVQLWTTSNYHWYLKQEITFAEASRSHGDLYTTWHPERSLHLACASIAGNLRLLGYASVISGGSLISPHDLGIVAVIDGKTLKVTPLRTANVPPPMALDELALPAQAIDVAHSADGRQLAVLHARAVTVWAGDYSSKPMKKASLLRTINLMADSDSSLDADLHTRQIALSPGSEDWTILCTADNASGGLRSTAAFFAESLPTPSDSPIASFASRSIHDTILVQDEKGEILTVQDDIPTPAGATLPTSCPVFDLWEGTGGTSIAFGLSDSGVLHIVSSDASPLRVPGCTSFLVTSSHLIYTTSQHLLKFVHLQHGTGIQIPLDEPEKDERCRNVERGARVITVVPSAFSLILQMPRGNLETIYPRALVLAGIRQRVTSRDYKRAFLICRTHRVDMNILHDYAPASFMRDIALFVNQVKKTEYIDLFISSLTEENVAETTYKETLPMTVDQHTSNEYANGVVDKPVGSDDFGTSSKVNRICDAFLQVLKGQSSPRLQNIITTHVCKSPPDLEAGLHLVSELRQQGKQEDLEQAVDHICFLADVNQLYDTALGIYDLDVALLVAQQSQKDPREYLPYLQRLHGMDLLRRRFSIDNDLKRYQKALSHLHTLDVFDEIKDYVSKHDLHSTAMELYRYDNPKLTELMRLYADRLSSRNRYKEAGIAYEFVQDYVLAYEAYRAASMWQECLATAALASVGKGELTTLATDLANSLEEAKDFDAAATVHLEYLYDLEAAVRLLCKGYYFAKAMRLVAMRNRTELLKTSIDSGLVEASAAITEMMAEMKSQLSAQVPRLRELRQKKADDPMAFLDGGGDGGDDDIPDNLSIAPTDASTTGTFMTRYTNRSTGTLATNATRKTSKNRRREERKRAKGKKGTVYEEEYLVNSVARLIERLNSMMVDVAKLVEGLMRRAMRERAVAVEAAMQDVLDACTGCLQEVFGGSQGDVAGQAQGPAGEEVAARPFGGQGVLWDALAAAGQRQVAPTLRAFERLSLLS